MDNNRFYWDQCRQPPAGALSPIKAGRLKGKTDIKPQWRNQIMTEMFGPCGIGWKYEITRQWTEPGSEGQVMAFVNVNLFINTPESQGFGWSEPIPGTGGSMLIAMESRGLHTSDEAWKMAMTDALSVAMKALGVASDIYMGNWTGSKYTSPAPEATTKDPVTVAEVVDSQDPPKNDTFTPKDNMVDVTVSPGASPAVVDKVEQQVEKATIKRPRYKYDSEEVLAIRKRCEENGINMDLFKFIATQANISTWSKGIGSTQLTNLERYVEDEIAGGWYTQELLDIQEKENEGDRT